MRLTGSARDYILRLRSENHVERDIGDIGPGVRSDLEDELVVCIDHVHKSDDVKHFQWFAGAFGRDMGWPDEMIMAVRASSLAAWTAVHSITCELKRLEPYYEHSANWLLQRGGQPGRGEGFLNR